MFTELSPQQTGFTVDYDGWSDTPHVKDKAILHYNGPAVTDYTDGIDREKRYLRAVERHHLGKGWRGFAYAYAVGMSGTVFRARGWNNYGAHRGDMDGDGISENNEGIPILLILGEGQSPNADMLTSVVELIEKLAADRRSDGLLEVYGHRDVSSTPCPGDLVYDLLLDWPPSSIPSGTLVLGEPRGSQAQAEAWAISNARRVGSVYSDATVRAIVAAYYKWGRIYGPRADLALAQSAKEAGFWGYGGLVSSSQWNFAGIGATGGVPGITYPSIEAGVRSHVLRMRMYARYDSAAYDLNVLVRPLPSYHWGKYPTIQQFDGVWAVPGVGYGDSIVNGYLQPLLETVVTEPLTLEQRVERLEGFHAL